MLRKFNLANLSNLFVLLCGVALICVFPAKYLRPVESTPSVVPPEILPAFSLGYSEVIADSLWLRVIQDFDYCEHRPPGVYDPSKFRCSQGWVYHMIDAVTNEAPLFRAPYLYGALMLSIVVNDIEGASHIFDKGVERFPTDWEILYRASYHAMSEEKDDAKASRLLLQAGKNGAPQWVYSLSARLNQKLGRYELARVIMQDGLDQSKNDVTTGYFKKRLAEIDKQIAEERAKQKH